MHVRRVYHDPIFALDMVTTTFLLTVIIYGLVAAAMIPVVHFIFFVIRESRRAGYQPRPDIPVVRGRSSTPVLPLRSLVHNSRAPRKNLPSPAGATSVHGGLSRRGADGIRNPSTRRLPAEEIMPSYVASNGVRITPNLGTIHGIPGNVAALAESADHPHAEYWSYGDPRIYERG